MRFKILVCLVSGIFIYSCGDNQNRKKSTETNQNKLIKDVEWVEKTIVTIESMDWEDLANQPLVNYYAHNVKLHDSACRSYLIYEYFQKAVKDQVKSKYLELIGVNLYSSIKVDVSQYTSYYPYYDDEYPKVKFEI